MVQKLIGKIGVLLLFVLAGSLMTTKPCFAASAKVDLTSDNAQVTVGDSVNVYIKIDSEITFGDFEANLIYDDAILEYQEGASVISGGNGLLRILDQGVTDAESSRKYALKFKALKVGDSRISFSDKVMVYNEAGNEMPVSSDELTIHVKAKATASADTRLESLITRPTDITPTFDKSIYEYSVNVSNETTKLIITAIPEDNNSIVTVKGNDILKEGENKVIVSVLAESGNIIEYTINVYRELSSEQPDGTDLTVTPAPSREPAELVESGNDKYLNVDGRYKILIPESDLPIPEGYVQSTLVLSDITITDYVPIDASNSDFVLIYAENQNGERGFFRYDIKEKTMQRFVVSSDSPAKAEQTDSYRLNLSRAAVVIAALGALCALLIAAVIWLYRKLRHYRKEDMK